MFIQTHDIYTWKPKMFKSNVNVRPIFEDTDGPTVTFDLGHFNGTDWHHVVLGGARTLALANVNIGQQFTLILEQDGTGSRSVTWFSGISWPAGVVPTLTATAGKRDVFTFKALTATTFLGFIAGQNL
jgi:hypothetical protein